ncbi:MAG: ABC transporter substrate-binding protein [Desulfomonilaceae bacterium]|jgi:ABC-type branched-subunit amino acid transport system substrate-binding protein
MKKGLKRLVVLAVLVGLTITVNTAWSADKVRGVSDTEILIGQWGPQTGPAALWGAVARGTGVFFDLVNEEGGIAGRKIKYFLRDDSYQPAKTKAIAKEFVESIGVFGVASGVGTSTGMAVRDYLMENKVPWVGPATGSAHWSVPLQKYLFAVYPRYTDEAYLLTQYLVEKMGKKKIAFFYQNDDYGKEGLLGAQKYAKKAGIQLTAEVPVEVTDTDLKSHALKLKESGAEAVILWILPKHAAIILGQAKAAGYEPQWVASSTLSDSHLMHKITKGLWAGVVYANFLNVESPLVKKYLEAQKKFAPNEQYTGIFFLAGFVFVEPMVEGLKRAGKDLNPDTFVKAMETIRHWNDWLGYDCTFTPEDHQGMKSVFISKCGPNGEPIKMSDWLTYKGE